MNDKNESAPTITMRDRTGKIIYSETIDDLAPDEKCFTGVIDIPNDAERPLKVTVLSRGAPKVAYRTEKFETYDEGWVPLTTGAQER